MGRVLEPEVMEGDSEASGYDEFDRIWGDVILQGFAESALRMGIREGTVLDVGTGPGRVAIRLARLNPRLSVQGIDLSASMLDRARQNAAPSGVSNVQFSKGDAKQIPFDDHTFDLVICHNLLHQLPEPIVALREIKRVVRPGGAILVRDVRRLPEPAMSLVLPLWCLGYSAPLRQQTISSFRAALTLQEFSRLAADAELGRVTIRTHMLTHQSIERPAVPYELPPAGALPKYPFWIRAMKSRYASHPIASI